jgi:hypothetical protein
MGGSLFAPPEQKISISCTPRVLRAENTLPRFRRRPEQSSRTFADQLGCSLGALAAEKRPSVPRFWGFASSLVIAAYPQVRLIPQDCLPDRQVKGAAGALQLTMFEQPDKQSLLIQPATATGKGEENSNFPFRGRGFSSFS